MGDSPLSSDGRAPRKRLSRRRLFGVDRSGPPPPETLAGAPLRPWTLPNAIVALRFAGIGVFLAFALHSGDGHDTAAAVLFGVLAGSDYLDGITARLTGQYSRLGALLDPLVDRLLVLAGLLVCFHYDTLPRWALVALAAREAFMLVLARYGLKRGVDLKINWPGRVGVAWTLSAPFWALANVNVLALVFLYLGLGATLLATALYVRDGVGQVRARGQLR